MGYYDAVKNNIPFDKDSKGFTVYYPLCNICGESVPSWAYLPFKKYVCRECKEIRNEQIFAEKSEDLYNNKFHKLSVALKRISEKSNLTKYKTAINWVKNNLDKRNWFQSTEEIMVALELIKRNIKAQHQFKILKYTVDFILTDEKVVLEIDGKLFHGKEKREYQQNRDKAILEVLDNDWDIIRISTEYINQNVTRLMFAIREVKRKRELVRKNHNGTLPNWYSDTAVK